MKKAPKKKENKDVVDGWMGTYGDMVTLLMAFFVLLYAFSDPDPGKMEELSSGLKGALTNEEVQNEFKDLQENLEELIEDEQLNEKVQIESTIRGIEIQMEGDSSFPICSSDIDQEMGSIIANISSAITDILNNSEYTDYVIEVIGHTDNLPPTGCLDFNTNWELSAYRATGIVDLLIESGIKRSKLKAIAMADADPLLPNTDEDGNSITENQAKNRRVEIFINKF